MERDSVSNFDDWIRRAVPVGDLVAELGNELEQCRKGSEAYEALARVLRWVMKVTGGMKE